MEPTESTELTEQDAYHLMSNFFELLKLGYTEEAFNLITSRSVEEIEYAQEGLQVVYATWGAIALAKKMGMK